jgi:hypothetical protein
MFFMHNHTSANVTLAAPMLMRTMAMVPGGWWAMIWVETRKRNKIKNKKCKNKVDEHCRVF